MDCLTILGNQVQGDQSSTSLELSMHGPDKLYIEITTWHREDPPILSIARDQAKELAEFLLAFVADPTGS